MPLASRGPRLAGIVALMALSVPGAGCNSLSPVLQVTPAAPSVAKPAPRGLIASVQSMTGPWQWPGTAPNSSPTAALYRQPTGGTTVSLSPFSTSRSGGPSPAALIQPVGARQGNEPGATASQIPVTTLPLPPSAFGGPAANMQVNQPTPGTGMERGNPAAPETLPMPRNGAEKVSGTARGSGTNKPAGPWPAPMAEVGPAHPLYPTVHRAAPVPAHPLGRVVNGIQDKIHSALTAQPIRTAMPVPPDAPREFQKRSLPPYIIEPPDVLLVQSLAALEDQQPVNFEHRVRPDGTISLGIYGEVYVAGMTLAQAKQAIIQVLAQKLKKVDHDNTVVDIIGYASKKYYVITDGAGNGEQVFTFPVTGNETVLDAIANINGLPVVASKRNIWLARATPDGSPHPKILPVDWKGVSQYGSASTNYQVLPNDRIYVKADQLRTFDGQLARVLSPIERIFGTVLLGSSTINSIRNGGQGGGNNNNN